MQHFDHKKRINSIRSSYTTLVNTLPINEILHPLHDKGILTKTAFHEISILPLSQSKTMRLLDCCILPSLKAGLNEPFDKLVEALMESDNPTAKILGGKLREREERIHVPSPVYSKLL